MVGEKFSVLSLALLNFRVSQVIVRRALLFVFFSHPLSPPAPVPAVQLPSSPLASLHFTLDDTLPCQCYKLGMDERTLNIIAEWELQEDMRRAEERAVSLGLLERDSDGTFTVTGEGERYFLEWLHSQSTLH
jgi:hypothetical protein